jgi:predicted NBD/HSP70 family sugar kinase
VTVGTGIGTGLVVNGELDRDLLDSEGGQILLPFEGQLQPWETFISGKAIVRRFGKKASEITDEEQWQTIGEDLGLGIIDLCAVTQPDIVIIGGGVGNHFDKYGLYLTDYVRKNKTDLVKMPEIVGAKDAELAALKGCFIYAQQHSDQA